MSGSSASTDSHSRLNNYNSGKTDYPVLTHVPADDDGRDLWFSSSVKQSGKRRCSHVERVLRRMGR